MVLFWFQRGCPWATGWCAWGGRMFSPSCPHGRAHRRDRAGHGRRTSGVGAQAIGGLMVRAAGTLANGTVSADRTAPRSGGGCSGDAGGASMAEWQTSQPGQAGLASCGLHPLAGVSWQLAGAAAWWTLPWSPGFWAGLASAGTVASCSGGVGVKPAAKAVPMRPRRTSMTTKARDRMRRMPE